MGGFKTRLQGAISGTKNKVQDLQLNSKLQKSDLCTYSEAWKIVYPIFEELLSRENWSEPAVGQDSESYKQELQEVVARIWGEKHDPTKVHGSVAAILNLTVIYFVCRHDLKVDSKTFFGALDWALREGSMEDVHAYFESGIFSDSPKEENLSVLIPRYSASNFPDVNIAEQMKLAKDKTESLLYLLESPEDAIYFSSGLQESYIEAGKGPRANILRYIEYYEPLFLDELYLGPLYGLDKSLKYVERAIGEHWLFCQERILIVPDKNDMSGVSIISKEEVRNITFGYAMTGVTKDGVVTSSIYKMYMRLRFESGLTVLRFEYLGTDQNEAKQNASDYLDGILEVISDHWEVEWSDEIIDEFDHYATTTTTTTYTYWGFTD